MNNEPVQEQSLAENPEEIWENLQTYLKSEINNFLWMHLPGSTTLEEADKVAGDWYDTVKELWDKAKQIGQ